MSRIRTAAKDHEIDRYILMLLDDRKWHYWSDVEEDTDAAFIKVGEDAGQIDRAMDRLIESGKIEVDWNFDAEGWVGVRRTDKSAAKLEERQLELF